MFDDREDTAWYSDQVIIMSPLYSRQMVAYILFDALEWNDGLNFSSMAGHCQFQGLPQQINIIFADAVPSLDVTTTSLCIKFQGGFVGSEMRVTFLNASAERMLTKTFYPDDINDLQKFQFETDGTNTVENVRKMEIVFEKSSDFFGRIIIYHLDMFTEWGGAAVLNTM